MKKSVFKIVALLLCVCMLSTVLCGCDFLEQYGIELPDWMMSFLDNAQKAESNAYVLPGPTDFYEIPDTTSPVIATYYAGHSVTYSSVVDIDGIQWAKAEEGWFILSGAPINVLVYTDTDKDIILTQPVDIFSEPSLSATVTSQLEAGKKIHLTQLASAGNNPWGLCDFGWILLDNCYFDLDDLNGYTDFGVIRTTDASFYSEPNIYSGVNYSPACGQRYGILAIVNVGALEWCYTDIGWTTTDDMYVEGTEGFRACSATVIDPTPLNVRIAPGTDNDILTTLTYGDRVNILERINYNGSDWGFTGTGWIFMDLTDID